MNTLPSAPTNRTVHERVDVLKRRTRRDRVTTAEDFAQFVVARWGSLYRLAYLLAASPTGAERLLQTALETAYVNWGRIRRLEDVEAYVRQMLAHTLVSSSRGARNREQPWDELPETAGDPTDLLVVDRSLLWPLLCVLSDRQRAVIVLRYYEDLNEAQIAEVLGCAPGTVKSQSRAAIGALRRALVASDIGEPVGGS